MYVYIHTYIHTYIMSVCVRVCVCACVGVYPEIWAHSPSPSEPGRHVSCTRVDLWSKSMPYFAYSVSIASRFSTRRPLKHRRPPTLQAKLRIGASFISGPTRIFATTCVICFFP